MLDRGIHGDDPRRAATRIGIKDLLQQAVAGYGHFPGGPPPSQEPTAVNPVAAST